MATTPEVKKVARPVQARRQDNRTSSRLSASSSQEARNACASCWPMDSLANARRTRIA